MRILLISREYPPFVGGGIGAYTERMSRALAAAGHGVVVLTVARDGREHREERHGVRVVRLPFLREDDWSRPDPSIESPETLGAFGAFHPVAAFGMQIARALPGLVREFAIDLIEAPECGGLAWFALNARRLGRGWASEGDGAGLAGTPLVVHVHSPTEWIEHWNRSPAFDRASVELKAMEADSLAWADGLVCPSEQVGTWVENRWGLAEGSIEACPLPMGELEEGTRDVAAAGGHSAEWKSIGGRRLLFVGRLEPRKGIDVLLEAFRIAVERGADLRLDIAGRDTPEPGSGRPFGGTRLERLPRAVRERVVAHGELSPDQLAPLRAAAHIAVVPSPSETGPYTLIEAMASGMVCVASRAGGMAEMIRDGTDGLLFEPGDAGACAEALVRAASMKGDDARRTGVSAARRAVERSGAEAVVRRRIEHYQRVIAPRRLHVSRAGAAAEPPIVVVGERDGESGSAPLLADSLGRARAVGVAFVHGWTTLPSGRVLAFGTPRLESLALAPRSIGPVAVEGPWLESPLVRRLVDVRPAESPRSSSIGLATVESTWELCVALAAAGAMGAVDPSVLSPVPGSKTARDLWRLLPDDLVRRVEARIGRSPSEVLPAELGTAPHPGAWPFARRIFRAVRRRVLRT